MKNFLAVSILVLFSSFVGVTFADVGDFSADDIARIMRNADQLGDNIFHEQEIRAAVAAAVNLVFDTNKVTKIVLSHKE